MACTVCSSPTGQQVRSGTFNDEFEGTSLAVVNAEWTGVPLAAVIERARLKPGAVEDILGGADQGEVHERLHQVFPRIPTADAQQISNKLHL